MIKESLVSVAQINNQINKILMSINIDFVTCNYSVDNSIYYRFTINNCNVYLECFLDENYIFEEAVLNIYKDREPQISTLCSKDLPRLLTEVVKLGIRKSKCKCKKNTLRE